MICKSNNNSHRDSTSAFFQFFFSEKDPHLNAVEQDSQSRKNKYSHMNSSQNDKRESNFTHVFPIIYFYTPTS